MDYKVTFKDICGFEGSVSITIENAPSEEEAFNCAVEMFSQLDGGDCNIEVSSLVDEVRKEVQ